MTAQNLDRNKIKENLEREYKRLKEDFDSVVADMNKLGATTAIAGQEKIRAEEYRQLEFKGSIVQQSLSLCKQLIIHAEYCDHYIKKNEDCHNLTNIRIDKTESSIKPLLEVKRDFLGVSNLTTMIKKSPIKLIEWGAIMWLVKYIYIVESVPK